MTVLTDIVNTGVVKLFCRAAWRIMYRLWGIIAIFNMDQQQCKGGLQWQYRKIIYSVLHGITGNLFLCSVMGFSVVLALLLEWGCFILVPGEECSPFIVKFLILSCCLWGFHLWCPSEVFQNFRPYLRVSFLVTYIFEVSCVSIGVKLTSW